MILGAIRRHFPFTNQVSSTLGQKQGSYSVETTEDDRREKKKKTLVMYISRPSDDLKKNVPKGRLELPSRKAPAPHAGAFTDSATSERLCSGRIKLICMHAYWSCLTNMSFEGAVTI